MPAGSAAGPASSPSCSLVLPQDADRWDPLSARGGLWVWDLTFFLPDANEGYDWLSKEKAAATWDSGHYPRHMEALEIRDKWGGNRVRL